MLPDVSKLEGRQYSRRELQHFCQQFGIKANGKNEEMYQALLEKNRQIYDEQLQQIRYSYAANELKMSVSLAKSQFDEEPHTEQVSTQECEAISISVSQPKLVPHLCESDSASRSQNSQCAVAHQMADAYPASPPESHVQVIESEPGCEDLIELVEQYRQQAKLFLKQNFDRRARQFQRQAAAELMVIPPQKRAERIDFQAVCAEGDVLKHLTAKLDGLIRK